MADREQLARAVSAVLGISARQALRAVSELETARERQRGIAKELEKYHFTAAPVVTGKASEVDVVLVSDQDGGTLADDTGTKPCQRCGEELSTTEFAVRRLSRDGLCSWHRGCMRSWREENAGREAKPHRPRLTAGQRERVLAMLAAGEPYGRISAETSVSQGSVSRIRQGL